MKYYFSLQISWLCNKYIPWSYLFIFLY